MPTSAEELLCVKRFPIVGEVTFAFEEAMEAVRIIFAVFLEAPFVKLCFRPTTAVAAENLFLRRQLGLFTERKIKPRRATDAIRFTLARLSRLFDRRNALTIVKPDTLVRWHRKGFRLFWKWKSQPRGRPRVLAELRKLILEMATRNPHGARSALLQSVFRVHP